jgi:hypothetical protein
VTGIGDADGCRPLIRWPHRVPRSRNCRGCSPPGSPRSPSAVRGRQVSASGSGANRRNVTGRDLRSGPTSYPIRRRHSALRPGPAAGVCSGHGGSGRGLTDKPVAGGNPPSESASRRVQIGGRFGPVGGVRPRI